MFRLWGEKLTDFQVVRVSPFYTWLHFADQPDVTVAAPAAGASGGATSCQRWAAAQSAQVSSGAWDVSIVWALVTDNINGYNPISKWGTYASLPPTDDQFVFCVRSAPRHIGQCIGGCDSEPRHGPYSLLWDCKKSQWLATFCDNDRNNIPDRVTADHLLLHNHNNSGWNALLVTK